MAYTIWDAKGSLVGHVTLDTAKRVHGSNIESVDHEKKKITLKKSSPYSNGRQRAMNAIGTKMMDSGIENDLPLSHRKTLIEDILKYQDKLGENKYNPRILSEMSSMKLRMAHEDLRTRCGG